MGRLYHSRFSLGSSVNFSLTGRLFDSGNFEKGSVVLSWPIYSSSFCFIIYK